MYYTIVFEPAAERNIASLPSNERKRIRHRIDMLAHNPRPSGVTKLRGMLNRWCVRVGNYRIIYEIHGDRLVVLVVRIQHRREVYRK